MCTLLATELKYGKVQVCHPCQKHQLTPVQRIKQYFKRRICLKGHPLLTLLDCCLLVAATTKLATTYYSSYIVATTVQSHQCMLRNNNVENYVSASRCKQLHVERNEKIADEDQTHTKSNLCDLAWRIVLVVFPRLFLHDHNFVDRVREGSYFGWKFPVTCLS